MGKAIRDLHSHIGIVMESMDTHAHHLHIQQSTERQDYKCCLSFQQAD